MSNDPFADLRQAVAADDEWPTHESRTALAAAARRFVRAIDQRAETIAYHRNLVTPTVEALTQFIGGA